MHQELAGINSLQIPTGAGPNDPAIVIGNVIPPELIAFYGGNIEGVEIFRSAAGTYTYTGITPFGKVEGSVTGGVVSELFSETASVPGTTLVTYGDFGQYDLQFNGATSGVLFGNSFVGISSVTDFIIDGVSAGRGLVAQAQDAAASAAVGAEAITLTIASATYRTGRAFEAVQTGVVLSSVANVGIFRVRKTNLGGTTLLASPFDHRLAGSGQKISDRDIFVVTGASDVTAVLVQTTESTTGTTTWQAAGPAPRRIRVYDIGAAVDYPGAPVLA